MVATPRNTTAPRNDRPDWSSAFAANLIELQRMQLEAFVSWQQTIAAYYEDLWDQWACRWAGGVPIDA